MNQNLNTEEDSSDIKSFITRFNEVEECIKESEESVCNISNYSEVVNQIKQFTLQ